MSIKGIKKEHNLRLISLLCCLDPSLTLRVTAIRSAILFVQHPQFRTRAHWYGNLGIRTLRTSGMGCARRAFERVGRVPARHPFGLCESNSPMCRQPSSSDLANDTQHPGAQD